MAAKLKPFRDQVIVIADATTAVGLATANAVARDGGRVLLIARRETALGEAVRSINNAGGIADYAVADPGHPDALAAAGRAAVARFGRVDRWVVVADPSPDDAEVANGCRAAAALLRRAAGALVVVGATAAIASRVEALRGELAGHEPPVAVTLVRPAGADPERVAETILRCLERPRREVGVGGPLAAAARHPGLVAAIGLGGLALAAGAFAAFRRRRVD